MKVISSKPIYLGSPSPWGSQASPPFSPPPNLPAIWSTRREFPEGPCYLPLCSLKESLKIPPLVHMDVKAFR